MNEPLFRPINFEADVGDCTGRFSVDGIVESHAEPVRNPVNRAPGLSHGAFCVGCCCALMLLLFTAGVMNLLWVAVLAVLVLLQKALPYPRVATTATGTAMAVVGLVLVLC
jgi:predicted metal-binding membrane protein